MHKWEKQNSVICAFLSSLDGRARILLPSKRKRWSLISIGESILNRTIYCLAFDCHSEGRRLSCRRRIGSSDRTSSSVDGVMPIFSPRMRTRRSFADGIDRARWFAVALSLSLCRYLLGDVSHANVAEKRNCSSTQFDELRVSRRDSFHSDSVHAIRRWRGWGWRK